MLLNRNNKKYGGKRGRKEEGQKKLTKGDQKSWV
jgi:hypothetical protein